MGFSYLNGNTWGQVTRDERFFCMQLYRRIMERGLGDFIRFLNSCCGTTLSPECQWEVGYEVCFYRDFWHFKDKKVPLLSRKRTFDLCLFSEETIVVIEAKCHEEFETDQLQDFGEDRKRIQSLPGLENVKVVVLALASKRYQAPADVLEYFDPGTKVLCWEDLADHYDGDPLLKRAGDIYSGAPRFNSARNTGGSRTGRQLLDCLRKGEDFWVGRKDELLGIEQDIKAGKWHSKKYQTNKSEGPHPPASCNWFRLSSLKDLLHLVEQEAP